MPVDLLFVLIIILVLVVMWRGPKTLPKLGEALGRGVRGAREEAGKAQAELQARASDDAPTPVTPAPGGTPAPAQPTAGSSDEQRPA